MAREAAHGLTLHFIHQFAVKSVAIPSATALLMRTVCRVRAERSMAYVWRGPRLCILWASLAATFVVAPSVARAADRTATGAVTEPVVVHIDQAKLLKLPDRTATLVIGNPLIADATVQPGGNVVVTAKSYGMTNLIALDRSGATLNEYAIQVVSPVGPVVVVYRGVERESYSCAPDCERRITLGDSPTYFGQNLTSLGSYNTQAQGGGQQQPK
jgi:Flp pilus assembly secretin CpaC